MSTKVRVFAIALALSLAGRAVHAQCKPAVQRLVADRRFDEARAQVAAPSPDDTALECLGRISMAMNRPKEASEFFEKAIKANDRVASHHLWLGNALGNLADSTSKIKLPFLARRVKSEFEKTVALDPTSVDGRSGLVEFYSQAPGVMGGSRERALEQVREIMKLNPMRGHFKAADLYLRDKKTAEAERELITAEQIAPDSAATGYTLGSFYQNQQRWSEAFAVYDRMERRFPAEWLVRFQVGRTAALSGAQLERGERELRGLIASPPPDMTTPTLAGAHHRLGMVLEKGGKKELARSEYQRAVTLAPSNEAAKRSLAALR